MESKHISVLESKLRELRAAYDNGVPLVGDDAYDALEDALRDIDPDNPFLKQVGSAPAGNGIKVRHIAPMGSLSKAQTVADITAWVAKTPAPRGYVITEKLDGASCSLVYENGVFVRAVTRGDGEEGEDITANAMRMRFPKKIPAPYTGAIRGEVMLTLADFRSHFPESKNPRNTANGVMKRSDGAGCEHLTVFVYEFDKAIGDKSAVLDFAQTLGFRTPEFRRVQGLTDINNVYQDYIKIRNDMEYEIDGLVVEVNDRDTRDRFGSVDNRPKGAIAYKFPHVRKTTTLQDIVWQVGPTGRITPVAMFDTVRLAGADVSQASLHNVGYMSRLGGFRVGDLIEVSRRNDVIPAVESVVLASHDGPAFTHPDNCPACGETLTFEGEYLVCCGGECPAQISGAIRRWVDKIGVLNVGEGLIDALVESGLVHDCADLYGITTSQIANTTMSDGRTVGEATAVKAIWNLSQKMTLDLHIFVGSLGIPLFGRSMVKVLVDAGFNTLDKLRGMTMSDMAQIPGVGATKGKAFLLGLENKGALIDRLIGAGIKINLPKTSGKMFGKSMCMTGFRDAAMQAAFEAEGGTIKSGVGKGLTYLVAKDASSGSAKMQKAVDLGVTVLTPDQMRDLLR